MTRRQLLLLLAAVALVGGLVGWFVYHRRADNGPFHVGEEMVFRVELTTAAHSDFSRMTDQQGEGARHSIHSSIEGELILTVVRRQGDVIELLCQLRGAKVLLAADGGARIAEARAAGEQLRQAVAIEATRRGELRRLWVPAEWSETTVGLLRTVLASTQFVWPAGKEGAWELEQGDDVGTAVVAYEIDGETVRRTRTRYLPPPAGDDAAEERIVPVAEPEGGLVATIGDERRLLKVEGTEATNHRLHGAVIARSETKVAVEQVRAEAMPRARAEAARDAFTAAKRGRETTLLNQPSAEAVEASIHRNELGELTLEGYLALLAKPAEEETKLFLKGKALAHLEPMAARQFGQLLRRAPAGSRESRVLAQALAGAGKPEGSRALAEVVRARKGDTAFLLELLPVLGTVRRPTSEVDRVLVEVGKSAADQDVRWTAQLSLGALAKGLARSAPKRHEAILTRALDALRLAPSDADRRQALLVLGNIAAPRALAEVRRHTGHKDAGVRAAAVAALRWYAGAEVEADLCKALTGDADAQVRQEAANAFEVRPLSPRAVEALCRALAKDSSTSVRLAALARLAEREKWPAEARKAIQGAAKSDPDAEVRRAATEALER